jgi:hypothetical protein
MPEDATRYLRVGDELNVLWRYSMNSLRITANVATPTKSV